MAPSFTGLTFHVVRFGRCSFRRASVAYFSILSAPGWRAGQKIILQQLPYVVIVVLEQHYKHLCYTGIWGTLKETSSVHIPSLYLLNRCSLRHCSPMEGFFSQPHGSLPVKAFMYTQHVCKRVITDLQSVKELHKQQLHVFIV